MKKIKNDLEEVKSSLDKSVIEKAKRMDRTAEWLSNVKVGLKSIKLTMTETGEEQLKVEYEIPPIYLQFAPDNTIVFNPAFYSINMLDLISADDMVKIGKAIEKAKIKKK